MINLMASLRKRIKAVSLSAWLVCALVVLIGGWLIAVITKPPSAAQLQRNAELEYYQRYNKFLPGEKTPEYDYKKYHMIKKDGRYFIIPRDYGTFNGVAFYWPSKTPYSLLIKGGDEDDGGKSQITVFIESKRFRISNPDQPKIDLSTPESCDAPVGTPKRWNGLVVWLRFDSSHDKDWPKICLEIVRILSLVKEVKNHE
jgi:hypothetical protein